jgi:hypothetical protein
MSGGSAAGRGVSGVVVVGGSPAGTTVAAALHWPDPRRPAAASINVKFPVPKLATAVPT